MKRIKIIFLVAFILAFCSIVYELLLAQLMAAFLGNTVLRYSVTIGLYMFSMGLGALAAEGKSIKHPVLTLLQIEILMTIFGGFAVVVLYWVFNLFVSFQPAFSILAHVLIILIGVLTGFEIPLLMEIRNKEVKGQENAILGVDYAGAFLGTIIFAFVFYPGIGLVPAAFFTGCLNSAAGILLFTQRKKVKKEIKKQYYVFLFIQGIFLIAMAVYLMNSERISGYLINQYTGG